jgi:hypothetical protein
LCQLLLPGDVLARRGTIGTSCWFLTLPPCSIKAFANVCSKAVLV